MMRLLPLCSLFLLLALAQPLLAQREYTRWYFGANAGIDFSSGAPIAVLDGPIDVDEGTATICDPASGELLFSTDGITVYNREHRAMPNGTGLKGHRSSTQSAVIVPLPCDTSTYIIFTTDAEDYDDPPNDGLHYSIVDMRLDGGRGAVTQRNVRLLDIASEKLVAVVHGNRRDYWVIAHSDAGNTFFAYRVDRNGVDPTPVVSVAGIDQGPTGAPFAWSPGQLKASPDGRWLAQMLYAYALPCELFSFDAMTGVVSRPIVIAPADTAGFYGASFSPDNSKLYIQRGRLLYQYDLSTIDSASIAASRTLVAAAPPKPGGMQLGPDGRVYIARDKEPWLAAITNPNAAGAACGYVDSAVDLRGRLCLTGMPTNIDGLSLGVDRACLPPQARFSIDDTVVCAGACVAVADSSRRTPARWEWTFEGAEVQTWTGPQPGPICYRSPGRHRVRLIVSNDNGLDTAFAHVDVLAPPTVDAGPDMSLCPLTADTLRATANGTPPFTWRWSPSIGLSCSDCPTPEIRLATTTRLRLDVIDANGCASADSLLVTVGADRVATVSVSAPGEGAAGDTIMAELLLDGALTAAESDGLRLSLAFDRRSVYPLIDTTDAASLLAHPAMTGWSVVSSQLTDSSITLRVAPPSRLGLTGPAALLRVPFRLLLGPDLTTSITPSLTVASESCVRVDAVEARILVSICGAAQRRIDWGTGAMTLRVAPHPAVASSRLFVESALSGDARVAVYDRMGDLRLAYDVSLDSKRSIVAMDWESVPSGAYTIVVTRGADIARLPVTVTR